MKQITCFLLLLNILQFSFLDIVWAHPEKTFQTDYTKIYYLKDQDIYDFIWRLGGQRLEFLQDPSLSSYRIDRLVDRVQAILDMRPEALQFGINLKRGILRDEKLAFYEYSSGDVFVSVDYVNDGVLAHEIAHVVINKYFNSSSPSKMQEILAQYVDQHLWSDY